MQNLVTLATSEGTDSIQDIITSLQMCSKNSTNLPLIVMTRVGLHSSQDDIPRVNRKTFANRSFKVVGCRWCNNLPIDIQRSSSITTFKKQIKLTFLNFIITITFKLN